MHRRQRRQQIKGGTGSNIRKGDKKVKQTKGGKGGKEDKRGKGGKCCRGDEDGNGSEGCKCK